jgi:large subunit ribosomal protein L21
MYAVIRTGGKQYKVSEGETLEVEHLSVKGDRVTFAPILVVTDEGKTIYGRRELKPYTVTAKLVGETKGDKIDVFKYRPKSGYAVRRGHRQLQSVIEITSIGTKEPTEPKEEKEPTEPKEEKEPTEPKEETETPKPKEEKEPTEPKEEKEPTEPKEETETPKPKEEKERRPVKKAVPGAKRSPKPKRKATGAKAR